MTREELFAKAKAARKEEKTKEGNRGTFQFDDIKWGSLSNDHYSVMRLLGNPADTRMGDPTSAKVVFTSKIVADNGKQMKVNWPSKQEGEGWLLWKIYDKVMAYTWDKVANARLYHNQKKHPDMFNRVFKNGRPENAYEKGWKPSQVVLINAIDRSMMDWHRENKKTCLISKKVGEGDNGTMYYDFGIPYTLYTKIFDDIVSYAGDWESYDVIIRKYTEDPWYKVFHAVDDVKKLGDEKNLINGTLEFAGEPLSEEEKSWERWNIDKYCKITSYTKIHSRLKLFIQEVDAVFKTHFFEELEKYVEAEKADKDTQADSDDGDETEDTAVAKKETTPEVKTEATPTRKPRETKTIDWAGIEAKGFKGISKLTPAQKNAILSFDGTEFQYDKTAGECYACQDQSCGFGAPETFTSCPKCGVDFA